MPDPFPLAPTSPITRSITFSAEQRPYVEAWYLDTKLAGETINEFVTRLFTQRALFHRRALLIEQSRTEAEAAIAADQAVHEVYTSTVDADLETVKGQVLP